MPDVARARGPDDAPRRTGREASRARPGERRADARRRLALRRLRRIRGGIALYLAVAAGAMIGGVLRALASHVVPDTAGFVGGTLLVNVLGSFVIGLYAGLTGPDGRLFVSAGQRAFVMIGFCGGFTTFSAFSLEAFRLAAGGAPALAAANAGVSLVTWLAAAWAGLALASRMNRMGGL